MRVFMCLLLIGAIAGIAIAQDPPAEGEDIPPAKGANIPPVEYTPAKVGDYWYGMYTPDDKPEGYARLQVKQTSANGRHFDWELHIAYEGGTYEESRKLTLDSKAQMTYAETRREHHRCLGAREGNVFVGKYDEDDLRVEVGEGAISSMPFLLAASMPLMADAALVRHVYNDAQEFKDSGKAKFKVEGKEMIELPEGKVEAWKIVLEEKTATRPIWVNDAREIVQVDWGKSNLMKLHREKTAHLFTPAKPTLTQLNPDDKAKLSFEGVFPGFTLEEMWKAWTTADGLKAFWAPKAEIEGKVGGKYWLLYPKKEHPDEYHYRMLGKITHWDVNKKFGTTWHWDFEPDEQVLNVEMEFEKVDGGVKLKITHGNFGDTKEEQDNRTSIAQGWEFFCTKLKKLKP